jgi:hypothetical protein
MVDSILTTVARAFVGCWAASGLGH